MNITINGESVDVNDGISISELLKVREVKMPDMVTVEHNGEILERDNFDSTNISNGDSVEFLYFMGGGSLQ